MAQSGLGSNSAEFAHKAGGVLKTLKSTGGISLLFAAGTRPTADDVERLLTTPSVALGPAAQVGHRPSDDAGWMEGPETMKLAGRLVDHLVRRGPIKASMTLPGSNGELLLLEPSADGKHIVIKGSA